MQTIYTNEHLRGALYSIYTAQFHAIRSYPEGFTKADATRMLTSLMGARPWSWRVVGVTSAALDLFAANDFMRPPHQLQRGHKQDRSSTAQALYLDIAEPMSLVQFFDFFLERDKTVIMTNEENKHRPDGVFPDYIDIDPMLGLFPSGTLVGWQHRKQEIKFLRELHAAQSPR
ncbi:hypothetical protein [Ralstonia pseudosolanacearum]|uniref:hypothetical protein n=1 Tax=Ralstonia pseudosolanacearum TaxID=1310165 RepID=UPI003D04B78B